jgi:hypothetical protein
MFKQSYNSFTIMQYQVTVYVHFEIMIPLIMKAME